MRLPLRSLLARAETQKSKENEKGKDNDYSKHIQ